MWGVYNIVINYFYSIVYNYFYFILKIKADYSFVHIIISNMEDNIDESKVISFICLKNVR